MGGYCMKCSFCKNNLLNNNYYIVENDKYNLKLCELCYKNKETLNKIFI
jgi:hypothetical protein